MAHLIVLHDCATVQLTRGRNTLIDESDAGIDVRFWHAQKSRNCYYATKSASFEFPKGAILHRFLTNAPPGMHVDHINGDGLDNRRANLRVCTHAENHRNRHHPWGRSKYKGVTYRKDRPSSPRPWKALIKPPAKKFQICIGAFATEIEAALAYDKAARELFGEFACTNADIYGDYSADAA